jgi:hypothetical protein
MTTYFHINAALTGRQCAQLSEAAVMHRGERCCEIPYIIGKLNLKAYYEAFITYINTVHYWNVKA